MSVIKKKSCKFYFYKYAANISIHFLSVECISIVTTTRFCFLLSNPSTLYTQCDESISKDDTQALLPSTNQIYRLQSIWQKKGVRLNGTLGRRRILLMFCRWNHNKRRGTQSPQYEQHTYLHCPMHKAHDTGFYVLIIIIVKSSQSLLAALCAKLCDWLFGLLCILIAMMIGIRSIFGEGLR